MSIRENMEQICADILLNSMEYNGETAAVYEEAAAATNETLINFILEWAYEILN